MKYVFFPGNSARNKIWIDSLANQFTDLSKEVVHYSHWENGQESIDFQLELDKVREINIKDDCIAICKSAGCYLSYIANKENVLDIQKYIFIGFPYSWFEMKDINPIEMLKDIDKEILIIQKSEDPAMPFGKLKSIIRKNSINAKMIEYNREGEPVDNHSYEDVKYLKETIDSFTELS
jgi:hypothetical protein